jgi:hypothetical protein
VENTPKCRLINPAKSESEMLSIIILDKIKNLNVHNGESHKKNWIVWQHKAKLQEYFYFVRYSSFLPSLYHLKSEDNEK